MYVPLGRFVIVHVLPISEVQLIPICLPVSSRISVPPLSVTFVQSASGLISSSTAPSSSFSPVMSNLLIVTITSPFCLSLTVIEVSSSASYLPFSSVTAVLCSVSITPFSITNLNSESITSYLLSSSSVTVPPVSLSVYSPSGSPVISQSFSDDDVHLSPICLASSASDSIIGVPPLSVTFVQSTSGFISSSSAPSSSGLPSVIPTLLIVISDFSSSTVIPEPPSATSAAVSPSTVISVPDTVLSVTVNPKSVTTVYPSGAVFSVRV